MKYILFIVVLSLFFSVPGLIDPVYAQEAQESETVAETEQGGETPPAAIRLKELEISLPSLEIMYIPRREVDLPPIKFAGTYLSGKLAPAPKLFAINEKDLKPLRVEELAKLLAKERK